MHLDLGYGDVCEYNGFLRAFEGAGGFNALHLNCQRVCNLDKFDSLGLFFDSLGKKPAILGLCETWFLRAETGEDGGGVCMYEIEGYSSEFSSRDQRSAGVAVYVREGVSYELLERGNGRVSYIHLRLDGIMGENGPLYFTEIYMPRFSDYDELFEVLTSLMESVGGAAHLIQGDFNIDVFKTTTVTTNYELLLESYGYIRRNSSFVTRPVSKSLIDHVWSSFPVSASVTIENEVSDHSALLTFFESRLPLERNPRRRVLEKTDWIRFRSILQTELSQVDRFEFLSLNVNEMLDCVVSRVKQAHVQATSQKHVRQAKSGSKPWIDQRILDLSVKKSRLWRQFKREPGNVHLSRRVQNLEHLLRKEKKEAKNRYFSTRFQSDKPIKDQWRDLNQLLGRRRTKTVVHEVEVMGQLVTDKAQICQGFNEYFTEVGSCLHRKISNRRKPVFKRHFQNSRSMVLFGTDEQEIERLILGLKSDKAKGPDDIPNMVWLNCASDVSWFLAVCVNRCFESGIYPAVLKVARVVPLHKGGAGRDFDNYRPVSVLNGLNKIFEKALHVRLVSFLESASVLYASQFGFRKACGTTNACMEVVDHIYEQLDAEGVRFVSGLFVDLSKAFDCVSHRLLLNKLEKYGIRGAVNDLLADYLRGRMQYVALDDSSSELREVRTGVPQGSVLGPLLFLIFLNDLGDVQLQGTLFIYADDCALFYSARDENQAYSLIRSDLESLKDYFSWNLLTMNTAKTKCMHFCDPRVTLSGIDQVPGTDVQIVRAFEYLGLKMDGCMKWDVQTRHVCKRVCPAIAALYRLRNVIPISAKYKIYSALVHSHVSYMVQVWGTAAAIHLKPVQILQNRALKLVFGLPRLTSSVSLYTNYAKNLLPVQGLHIFSVLKYVKSSMDLKTHSNVEFQRANQGRLRPRFELVRRNSRTKRGAKRISILGVNYFNLLPVEVRSETRSFVFLREVGKHLHETGTVDRLLKFGGI